MRLLRFLLPGGAGRSDGRLSEGVAAAHRGDRAPHQKAGGEQRLYRRRHPQLLRGETPAGATLHGAEKIHPLQGCGDHPGGQPGQRGSEIPPAAAAGGSEPPVHGDAVRLRLRAGERPPPPHLRPDGEGGAGGPVGQDQEPEPGSDLRPARADGGELEEVGGSGPGPVPGAPVLLRPDGGGGHPAGPAGGQGRASARRRRTGGPLPVDGWRRRVTSNTRCPISPRRADSPATT